MTDDDLIETIKQTLAEGKIKEAQRMIVDALEHGVDLPSAPTLKEIELAAMARALGVLPDG